MIKKYLLISFALILSVITVSGCSVEQETEKREISGLDELGVITVVSREEGSGTRNVFAESLDFFDDATGLDLTKQDCEIVRSGDEVLKSVSSDESAVGYVSAGTINDSEQQVRRLDVSGGALERNFHLAYSGKLSELETDFLTYIQSAGQEIVGENYETVKKITTFLSGKPEGSLKIGDSSSMAELMQELADAYSEINPNAVIEIIVTDSTNGLTGAMSGLYDLGMASRDLEDYEKELLESVTIARDEIAVIVNAENPLEEITAEDLKGIYTGEITKWQELNQ